MGAPASLTPTPRQRELLCVARALGIPWERILEREIRAERTLRGFVGEPPAEPPFWRFLSALSASSLDSWRVRERVNALLWEARVTRSGAAARAMRELVEELCGKDPAGGAANEALARHLRFAYERVRELERVARAAEKSAGGREQRLDAVVAATGCALGDAGWALARADSPGRGHRVDDAVRRVREEGFEIPQAGSDFESFRRLRRLARRASAARFRRAASAERRRPAASPDSDSVGPGAARLAS